MFVAGFTPATDVNTPSDKPASNAGNRT